MGFQNQLLGLILRQTLGESGKAFSKWIDDYTKDPSGALPKAITQANERSWQALELALAGEGVGGRLKQFFARGELQGLCQPIQAVAEAQGGDSFRRQCLRELKKARASGLLDQPLGEDLAATAAGFERVSGPEAILEQAWQVMGQTAAELNANGYTHLARLVQDRSPGKPLLLTAFGHFLRLAIVQDDDLSDEMNFRALRRLGVDQSAGFQAIQQAVDGLGGDFRDALHQASGEVLARLDQLADQVQAVGDQVAETHRNTLDIQVAIEGLGTHLSGARGETLGLLKEIQAQLHRLPASQGAVDPRLSYSIRGHAEQRLVKNLLQRFRQLPEAQRGSYSAALLNGLGKLELAAGDLKGAEGLFGQAAEAVHGESAAEAEAQHNRYRALLEQQDWTGAKQALERAAALDPRLFAPFDTRKYRIEAILGAGGFGSAWLCADQWLRRQVVIKTLHGDDLSGDLGQIFAEGQALSALRHTGIVQVYDAGYADPETQRRPYLVMEYLSGYQALDRYLEQEGPLDIDSLSKLARPLAEALHAAHQAGVLHRDVKPENTLVHPGTDGWRVKVIDFGLALKQERVAQSLLLGSGAQSIYGRAAVGTWEYAAPEQMGRRPEPVDRYSDVYGFGKTLSRALFGKTSPSRRDYQRIGWDHPLTELLDRCMEEDPAQRYQDFGEVSAFLVDAGNLSARQAQAAAPTPAQTRFLPDTAREDARQAEQRRRILTPQDIHGWSTEQVKTVQRQVAEALGRPVAFRDKLAGGGEGPEMLLIPPGRFLMGSPEDEPEREDGETQHPVTLTKPFALGRYAVSFDEYDVYCETTGVKKPSDQKWGREKHPVINVSWDDAVAYCDWLSEQTGEEYRLPSEAQWEYACRAGAVTAYGWGSEMMEAQANYGYKLGKTVPVDEYSPNAWGLYQMHGNVFEWVEDWYAGYVSEPQEDPVNTAGGSRRVRRGGGWGRDASFTRCAYRGRGPGGRYDVLGFRLLRK